MNPDNPNSSTLPHFLLAAAKKLNVSMLPFNARNSEEIDYAFAAMSRERADALIEQPEAIFNRHIPQIVGAALKARLPASYPHSGYVDGGGLMSYGIDYRDHYRGAATYVDKILKGAKPADLPVEQPTRFEFVVNLKTAKALGLTMPPEIMVQATRVIQ